jgi:hypothetical protein
VVQDPQRASDWESLVSARRSFRPHRPTPRHLGWRIAKWISVAVMVAVAATLAMFIGRRS